MKFISCDHLDKSICLLGPVSYVNKSAVNNFFTCRTAVFLVSKYCIRKCGYTPIYFQSRQMYDRVNKLSLYQHKSDIHTKTKVYYGVKNVGNYSLVLVKISILYNIK